MGFTSNEQFLLSFSKVFQKIFLLELNILLRVFRATLSLTSKPPSQERLHIVLNTLNQCKQEEISNRKVYLNLAAMDQADFLPEEVLAAVATLLSRQVYFISFFHL